MGKCVIIPEPKSVREHGEIRLKNKNISVVCDKNNSDVKRVVSLLSQDFRADFGIGFSLSARGEYSLELSILKNRNDVLGDEGYVLDTDDSGARIRANTSRGLFYGGQTLRQLVSMKSSGLSIRNCHIKDYPDFAIRGIHIDLKAQMLRFDYIRNVFRECARYKINTVLLEYEDKFPYEKHKEIVSPLALTSGEIDDLMAYAHTLGIQIIPKVQGLAHVEYILKHEKYFPLRENPASPTDLCPSHKEYFRFISEVYGEVISRHGNSRYFHIGCDESLLFGTCKTCGDKIRKNDREKFFAEVVNRIHGLVKSSGKETIMWGDHRFLYPKISKVLDKSIIMMPWKYHDYDNLQNYSFVDHLVDNKLDIIICPAARMSLDTSIFPDFFDRNRNTANLIKYAYKNHKNRILGVINSSWVTSRVPFETSWFGFVCSAELSWSPGKTGFSRFEKKFPQNYYGITRRDFAKVFYSLKGDRVWNEMLVKDSCFTNDPKVCDTRIKQASAALARINTAAPSVRRHVYNFDYLKLSALVTLHRQKRVKLLTAMKAACEQMPASKKSPVQKVKQLQAFVKDLAVLKKELSIIVKETKRLNKSMFKAVEVTKDISIRYNDEMQVLAWNIKTLNYAAKKIARRDMPLSINVKTEVNDIEYRYYHKPAALSPYDDSWNLNL